jgi:hypothetical protein
MSEEFETEIEGEIDVLEFGLCGHEIDEWIEKLIELKETKNSVELSVDDSNELLINYDNCDCGEEE